MKLFNSIKKVIASLALAFTLTSCGGFASQVNITSDNTSGKLEEGASLTYTLEHKEYAHGQKISDALRVLPDGIEFVFSNKTGSKNSTWVSALEYFAVTTDSKNLPKSVTPIESTDAYVGDGEKSTAEVTAKYKGENDETKVTIGEASQFEKVGENVYTYTHFEIDADWLDRELEKVITGTEGSLVVDWVKVSISLKKFKYTRTTATVDPVAPETTNTTEA